MRWEMRWLKRSCFSQASLQTSINSYLVSMLKQLVPLLFRSGFSVQSSLYRLQTDSYLKPQNLRLVKVNSSFIVSQMIFQTQRLRKAICLPQATISRKVHIMQMTALQILPQKVFQRRILFLGSAWMSRSMPQRDVPTVSSMQTIFSICQQKGFFLVSQMGILSQVLRRSSNRIAERSQQVDFSYSLRWTISSFWKLWSLSISRMRFQKGSTWYVFNRFFSKSLNYSSEACGFWASCLDCFSLSSANLQNCPLMAIGLRRMLLTLHAHLNSIDRQCQLILYIFQLASIGDLLDAQAGKCVLDGSSRHDHLDGSLQLVGNDPSKGIRSSDQTLADPVVQAGLLCVGVAGEDDGAAITAELKLYSEISHQQIDMLKGLDVLEMAGNRILLLFQLRQHHKGNIVVLEVLQQALVVLEVYLDSSPVYGDCFDAHLRVAFNCDFFGLGYVCILAHEDQVEPVGCQKFAVLEVILAVGDQSPGQMAILVQQLQLGRNGIGPLHCLPCDSESGLADGYNADEHGEVDKRFVVVLEVEVQGLD